MGTNEWDGVSETNDVVSTVVVGGDGEGKRLACDTENGSVENGRAIELKRSKRFCCCITQFKWVCCEVDSEVLCRAVVNPWSNRVCDVGAEKYGGLLGEVR